MVDMGKSPPPPPLTFRVITPSLSMKDNKKDKRVRQEMRMIDNVKALAKEKAIANMNRQNDSTEEKKIRKIKNVDAKEKTKVARNVKGSLYKKGRRQTNIIRHEELKDQ